MAAEAALAEIMPWLKECVKQFETEGNEGPVLKTMADDIVHKLMSKGLARTLVCLFIYL